VGEKGADLIAAELGKDDCFLVLMVYVTEELPSVGLKIKTPHAPVPHAPIPKGVPATQQLR